MKTCKDCVHYEVCKKNDNLYHTSSLTVESDVSDRCKNFNVSCDKKEVTN